MTFYAVHWEDDDRHAVARDDDPELFFLPDHGAVEGWQEHTLVASEGSLSDYLASDMGCRMCSEKMRAVLDESRSRADNLQWLPVVVHQGTRTARYWILHFPDPPDILDTKRTLFAGGGKAVVKAVIDPKAALAYSVTTFRGGGQLRFVVSRPTLEALQHAGCTGMSFSRMPGT